MVVDWKRLGLIAANAAKETPAGYFSPFLALWRAFKLTAGIGRVYPSAFRAHPERGRKPGDWKPLHH